MKKLLLSLYSHCCYGLPILPNQAQASDIKGHQMETDLNYWIDKRRYSSRCKRELQSEQSRYKRRICFVHRTCSGFTCFHKVQIQRFEGKYRLTTEIQNAAGAGILSGYPDGTFKAR